MRRLGLAYWLSVVLLASTFVAAHSKCATAQEGSARLLGHWKLAGDTQDSSGNNLHAMNRGVVFEADQSGPSAVSAKFRGQGEFLSVPHSDLLKLGTGDFSISLWMQTEQALDDDIGDLISKFDPVKRVGLQLGVRNNTGVTTSQTNERQLQFGIDSTTEARWTDLGRPGGESSVVPFSLAEFDGKLFAGTCEPGKNGKGDVYFLNEKREWQRIPVPHVANTVSSLAAHNGNLYAGTGKYRVAGSALSESENLSLGGQVFRLNPTQDGWVPIGHLPKTEAIGGMVAYKGHLYASSLYAPAGLYRYAGGENWTAMPTPNGKRVVALGVFNGLLWACSYDGGNVYRFDGESWTDMGQLGDNTQTYSFATYEGRLCVGTWRSGKVFRLTEQNTWEDLGRLGEELEVMAMLVHNGKLYAGTLPLAEVYRYDGGQTWTKMKQVDLTPDVKYRRVWTMAQHRGQLVCGVLPSGHVHALETGASVMSGKPVRAGWRQITAVKEKSRLSVYVDGVLQGTSTEFDPAKLDLSNQEPLRIGAGSGDTFQGRMSDVRLYQGALTAAEIGRMQRAQ